MMHGVRLEPRVSEAIDEAMLKWPAADRAWEAIEFTLAHDPVAAGVALVESGKRRMLVFHGAKSIGMPSITVLYELSDGNPITIYDVKFEEPKAPFAGRA